MRFSRAISSVAERLVYTEKAVGSIPTSPTRISLSDSFLLKRKELGARKIRNAEDIFLRGCRRSVSGGGRRGVR